MPDPSAPSTGEAVWPQPKFQFHVQWGGAEMRFQEVSGLGMEAQPIEYRAGNSPQFSVLKMPGVKKFGDVTLKRGLFKGERQFWDWFNEAKSTTIQRKPLTIRLLDESGAAVMVWTLADAWPSRVQNTEFKVSGNEVAIESLVVSHEGLSMAKG